MSRRPFLAAALLATTLLVPPVPAARAADEAPAAAPSARRAPAISVVTAARREIVAETVVTGSLVPREEIRVAVDIDGVRIESLSVDEGDTVAAGQVMARLATDTIDVQLAQNASQMARADAAIAQARSGIAEAQATEAEAAAALVRARALNGKGFTSQEILDQRVAAADTAKAQLENARRGLDVADADLALYKAQRAELELRRAKTEVKAPSAGLVLSRDAKVGAVAASTGDALFVLARDGLIELDAEVPETDLGALAPGQPVRVTPAGVDRPVTGTVRLVSPQVDAATRLGRVRVALPRDAALRSGAFARAVVETARSTGVVVPVSAVLTDEDTATVQVVKDGRIETRTVTVGLAGRGVVEIREGVAEGEAVVSRAGTFVRDGDVVTPVAVASEEAKG